MAVNPCDWIGIESVCDWVGDGVGNLAEDGAVKILSAIAEGVTSFAAMILDGLWGLIQRVTTPQTDADFLYHWAGLLFGISLPITVAFMVLQTASGMLRARGWTTTGAVRAVTGAAVAITGTAASVPVIHYLTGMVDGVAAAISEVTVGEIGTLGDNFAAAIGGDGVAYDQLFNPLRQAQLVGESAAGILGGLIGMIVLGFLMVLGGMAVFAALLIRTLLLYAVIVTGPIAFLGLVWEPARAWFSRWMSTVVALLFTKLGVVVVFGLGISAMNNLNFDGGILEALGRLMSGALLMLISALVPIVAFKFFGFLGEHTAEGLHAGASHGIQRSREAAGQMNTHRVLDRINTTNGSQSQGASPTSANGSTARQQPGSPPAGGGHATAGSGTARPAGPKTLTGGPGGAGAATAKPSTAGGGGSAAAGVGAVIGAGAAAAGAAANTGRQAGARVDADVASTSTTSPSPAPTTNRQPRQETGVPAGPKQT